MLVGQKNKGFFANAKAAAWWHAAPVLSHSPHAQSGGRGFNYRFDIQASHASAKARILGDRERLHCFRMALIYGQSPVIGQLVWAWELELASSPLPKGSSSGVVHVKPRCDLLCGALPTLPRGAEDYVCLPSNLAYRRTVDGPIVEACKECS